ncbi:MAG TPA: hypothetical protein VFT41_00260 [Gemmatimonadaceae bacterium]|nr:hypothetical protein [Gemmatimonadaceae bacterium]
MVLVDSEGRASRTFDAFRNIPAAGAVSEGPWALLADGTFILAPAFTPAFLTASKTARGYYLRVDSTGQILDTLESVDLRSTVIGVAPDTVVVPEFMNNALIAVDPTGRFVVTVNIAKGTARGSRVYTVRRRDLRREATDRWVFARTAVKMLPADREQVARPYVQLLQKRYRKPDVSVDSVEAQVDAASFRDPVSNLLVSPDGAIWLKHEDVADPPTWSIIDSTGLVCAIAPQPPNTRLVEVDGQFAWGLQWDPSTKSTTLRVYKLKPAEGTRAAPALCRGGA